MGLKTGNAGDLIRLVFEAGRASPVVKAENAILIFAFLNLSPPIQALLVSLECMRERVDDHLILHGRLQSSLL